MEQMMSIKDASKILGFKERTIYEWVKRKKIKGVKIGWEWRIPVKEVERLKRGE